MRVAVMSPQPRVSGVVTYSHHLREGFRGLGHECDVVTFTLSGKLGASSAVESVDAKRSGWGWSPLGADRCARWDRAAEVLGEYDIVVVEEPRCAPLDKKQMRLLGEGEIKDGRALVLEEELSLDELPWYARALAAYDKPTAWVLHDPGYGTRLAPFLGHLVRYAPPRLVVTHREGALRSAEWAGVAQDSELRIPHLPYRWRGPREHSSWPRVIGTTGRYINNKGQPTLALAAALEETPEGWQVEVAGASPLGAGPNHTFLTYEGLTKRYGWEGRREGLDVTRGWPWQASKGKRQVTYAGPYLDPLDAAARFGVHVNATDPAFSGPGSVEYTTLEAMDAGCMVVVPDLAVPEEGAPLAALFRVEKLANAELHPVDEARERTAKSLADAAWRVSAGCDDAAKAQMARHNYDLLDEYHAPERYAARIVEALR